MTSIPELAQPLKENIARSLEAPVKIDAEIYHMMDKRDEALISDEVLHGAMSGIFVYDFDIQGKNVSGISIRGAQHLARHYGGLKHRIVATTEKRGKLFIFKSYPSEGIPMQVTCSIVNELADQPDYYEALVEMTDIKTGNTVQKSKLEYRFEKKRDGTHYERPNYTTIAESKARRNAILDLVPQDVQEQFKAECRKLGKTITISPIDEKRDAIMKFATNKAIPLTREQVAELDWNQISGLSDAAREGLEAFTKSAEALGLVAKKLDQKAETKSTAKPEPKPDAAARKEPAKQPKAEPPASVDPETGEIKDAATAKAQPTSKQPEPKASAANPSLNFGD